MFTDIHLDLVHLDLLHLDLVHLNLVQICDTVSTTSDI